MLTQTQLTALRNLINSDPLLISLPNTPDGNSTIAQMLEATASPDWWVWKSFLPDSDIYESTSVDGTSWSWSIFIARNQGERDAWRQMVNMKGGLNPSLPNVRTAVNDIFSGVAGAAQRTHLLALSRRKASRAEKIFSTGTGSTASPANLGVNAEGQVIEGRLLPDDIQAARNLP